MLKTFTLSCLVFNVILLKLKDSLDRWLKEKTQRSTSKDLLNLWKELKLTSLRLVVSPDLKMLLNKCNRWLEVNILSNLTWLKAVEELLTSLLIQKYSISLDYLKNTDASVKMKVIMLKLVRLVLSLKNSSRKRQLDNVITSELLKNKSYLILKLHRKRNSLNSHKLGITTWVITKLLLIFHLKSLRRNTCLSFNNSKIASDKNWELEWSSLVILLSSEIRNISL